MAVLSGATASGRQFYVGFPPTGSNVTLYTAPPVSSNVTATTAGTSASSAANGSATAYIKEIVLCNTNVSAQSITLYVNGTPICSGLSVNPSDTKYLSGLNTMIPAGATITGSQGTANAIAVTISGTEIQ